jgi:hypothetical protein
LRERVLKLLREAVEELNATLPVEARLGLFESQVLSGEDGGLDSMGWINLTLLCEERIRSQLGIEANLTDAVLLDQAGALPATLGAFAELLTRSLEGL